MAGAYLKWHFITPKYCIYHLINTARFFICTERTIRNVGFYALRFLHFFSAEACLSVDSGISADVGGARCTYLTKPIGRGINPG